MTDRPGEPREHGPIDLGESRKGLDSMDVAPPQGLELQQLATGDPGDPVQQSAPPVDIED